MYRVIVSQTRPSADIPFFWTSFPQRGKQLKEFMTASPLVKLLQKAVSQDQLTAITVLHFDAEADYDAFMASLPDGLKSFNTDREAHNAVHGITLTRFVSVE